MSDETLHLIERLGERVEHLVGELTELYGNLDMRLDRRVEVDGKLADRIAEVHGRVIELENRVDRLES